MTAWFISRVGMARASVSGQACPDPVWLWSLHFLPSTDHCLLSNMHTPRPPRWLMHGFWCLVSQQVWEFRLWMMAAVLLQGATYSNVAYGVPGVVRKQQGICYTSWLQMTRAKIKNKVYWFLYISHRVGEGGIQLGCALDLEYLRLQGSSTTFFRLSRSLDLILSGDMTGLRETHIPNTQPPQENVALVNSATKKNTVKIWKKLRMALVEPWTNGFIF